ncbi:hypothetical protein As57867_022204, partial [Aphanomyces stellatus]
MSEDEDPLSAVVTAVRVRPMSDDERKAGCRLIVSMQGTQTTITDPAGLSPTAVSSTYRRQQQQQQQQHASSSSSTSPAKVSPLKRPSLSSESKAKMWKQTFTYDHSFWSCTADHPQYADQRHVYDSVGTHMLATAWSGLNCSLFAYGQTGAGKSFSMMGKSKGNHRDARGLIPRICQGLFDSIQTKSTAEMTRCTVKMSFVEIYNERVYDLLNPQVKESLKVREHPEKGTYVEHVSNLVVTSSHDIQYLLAEGSKTRTVASTHMNQMSSRSHAILTLTLHWVDAKSSQPRASKLCMVDLAGSERTDLASGDRLREAASINKSLSALGDVINALASNATTTSNFVQYRNSVLTRLLKDSLSGSSRLIMLAAISPCCIHYDETLSTLKYVDRAKLALLHAAAPHVMDDPATSTDDALVQLRMELTVLRSQLRLAQQGQRSHAIVSADEIPPLPEEQESVSGGKRRQRSQHSSCMHVSVPHLVNLNQDPRFTERIVYCVEEGITTVGAGDADLVPDILLDGHDVLPLHGVIHCTNGNISIRPAASASVFLNGKAIQDATMLDHGARLMLGSHHVFRFDQPHTEAHVGGIDWSFAHNELLEGLLPLQMEHRMGGENAMPATIWPRDAIAAGEMAPDPRVERAKPEMAEAWTQSEADDRRGDDPCHGDDGNVSKSSPDANDVREPRIRAPKTETLDACCQTTTIASCRMVTAATQYHFDSGIQFDENEKIILERKIAKLKLLLKKKDKQLKRETTAAAQPVILPPPPVVEPLPPPRPPTPPIEHTQAIDPATLDRLVQIQSILSSVLGSAAPPIPLHSTLTECVDVVEVLSLAVQDLWTTRPTSSKPLEWLFQELSSECHQQIFMWAQAQTLQLASAAKVIAGLESRFTSLCCTLNEQCTQETSQFEKTFAAQEAKHDALMAAQEARMTTATSTHQESYLALEETMAMRADAARQNQEATQREWVDKIEQLQATHVQELTAMSVHAALEDDKVRLEMTEWETKCASLVAEAEMVLCETRAMHAKDLRDQQDAVALQLYNLELQRMAQEETFLAAAESFVRSTDETMR